MTHYVVTVGQFDDYRIVGVFADEQMARDVLEREVISYINDQGPGIVARGFSAIAGYERELWIRRFLEYGPVIEQWNGEDVGWQIVPDGEQAWLQFLERYPDARKWLTRPA